MDIRVEIEQDIPIDAEQLGRAVAQADSAEQAEFFNSFAENANSYNWCMQASMIAREFDANESSLVISTLEKFIAHLEDRQNG